VIGGRVLDASTVVDFALVRPYSQALVWTAVEEGMVLVIPASALALAWADTPVEAHDALSVLLDLPNTVVEPLDTDEARRLGQLLAASIPRPATSPDSTAHRAKPDRADPDRADLRVAHVVSCGLRRGWPIVTGDAPALRRVAPHVEIDDLP
jgi:hypothetical protein